MLLLAKFKRINELLFALKLSENHIVMYLVIYWILLLINKIRDEVSSMKAMLKVAKDESICVSKIDTQALPTFFSPRGSNLHEQFKK